LSKFEIRIDREACRGAAECVYRAPQSFELDDEGKAIALDPPGDDEQTLIAAARSCPNFAIEINRSPEP
jgi:ferredoxin